MNKMLVIAMVSMMSASVNAMSLAEARGRIDAMIADPGQMTEIMKQLSAADQKTLVSEVNAAVAKLPGSAEERSAKVINVTRAAFRGADRKDPKALEALVAEVYATAPLESLCVLNENLSRDVFNRAADITRTYTDEQFVKIATNLVNAVNVRVAGMDDADVRGGFAALTMIRASNGSPASLADELAALLGESAGVAKSEWFPAALGKPANYDPMLASTTVEKAPNSRAASAIAGAQRHETLLSDFFQGNVANPAAVGDGLGDMSQVQSFDHDLYTRPRTMEDEKWNPDPAPGPGPQPYFGQVTH